MNVTLITVGVFCSISLAVYALGRIIVGSGRNEADGDRQRRLALGPLTHPLALALPVFADARRELQKDLMRAGYYHRYAEREFLATRNALVLGWLAFTIAAYWLIARDEPQWQLPVYVIGTVMAVILFSVPRLVLQAQAAARLQRIQRALPDALDMITMSMTGGLPLVAALDHVCGELDGVHPDLACELTIVLQHTRARSLDHALRRFADRIDNPDVQSLAALVNYAERLGSNVAGAFQDFSDSIRRSLRQRAEEQGNKASVKLLFPVVFCLAPPIYILLLGPALLEMRKFVVEENRPGGVLQQTDVGSNPGPLTPENFEPSIFRPASPVRSGRSAN